MTRDEFAQAVAQALETLGLGRDVRVADLAEDADGTLHATLEIPASPDTDARVRLPSGTDPARAPRELRGELRRALRLCPVCQRIGHVEKIRSESGAHEACRVVCPACGAYEIEQALIRDLRAAWERSDPDVLGRLPALSDELKRGAHPRLTVDDWQRSGSE
jgi:hypothetical protein